EKRIFLPGWNRYVERFRNYRRERKGEDIVDDKKLEEMFDTVKKMKEENPEEFSKHIENAKEKLEHTVDEEKKQRLQQIIDQAQNIKENTTKEEREQLIQEMKSQLNPEDQEKIQKAANFIKKI